MFTTQVTTLSDEQLIGQVARSGSMLAFEQLYERHAARVMARCLKMTKDRAEAEDLTHDVFLKLFRQAGKYDPVKPFVSWLMVLAGHTVMDHLRKRTRDRQRMRSLDAEHPPEAVADEGGIAEKRLLELRLEQLEHLLGLLLPDERLVLLMKYQDGLGVKDIAAAMAIGESAVKMRLKRSRDKVLELQNAHYGQP